ncbi:hypothetical protein GCM10010398_67810 [Streptomyces fimbriatus]
MLSYCRRSCCPRRAAKECGSPRRAHVRRVLSRRLRESNDPRVPLNDSRPKARNSAPFTAPDRFVQDKRA